MCSGYFTWKWSLCVQNAAGASSGQEGDVIGLFHERERVAFLESNLDKLSFQHNQVRAGEWC